MSDKIEVTLNGVVQWTYNSGTITVPPVIPPTQPPVVPPGQPLPPYPVAHDFGEGGGEFWPRDGRLTPAGQTIVVAFTVRAGGNPNLDVFPGPGNWMARNITDYFPYVSEVPETRGLPIGNTSEGRGSEHAAGIPAACYTPGRYYYAVTLDATQDWRFQFRQ